MSKKIVLIITLIILFLLFGTSLAGNFFVGDMNMIDEGQFAAWANHMLHGKLMFRDMYIVYGPLYVYPLFLLFEILGPSAYLVRLYLMLGSITGVFATILLMGQLKVKNWIIFIILVILFLVPIMNLRIGVGLWSIYFLLSAHSLNSKKRSIISGVLSAITFLVSPDFGIFVVVIAYIHYICNFIVIKNIKNTAKMFLCFIVGYFLVWVIFVSWAIHEKWLFDYVIVTFDVIKALSGINVPNGMNFPNPIYILTNEGFFDFIKFILSKEMLLYWSLIPYFASIFYLVTKLFLKQFKENLYYLFLLTFLGIFIYSILLTRNGVGHYYYTLPVNLIISSYFINQIAQDRKKRVINYFFLGLIVLYFLRILYVNNPGIKTIFNPHTYVKATYNNPQRVGLLNISESQKRKITFFQSFISQNTNSDDYVFFFNDEPFLYMLVDRLNPTRYDLPFAGNLLEKRTQMLSELIVKKPKYIFIDRDVWAIDGIPNSQRLPEVYRYILSKYILVGINDNVLIYKTN